MSPSQEFRHYLAAKEVRYLARVDPAGDDPGIDGQFLRGQLNFRRLLQLGRQQVAGVDPAGCAINIQLRPARVLVSAGDGPDSFVAHLRQHKAELVMREIAHVEPARLHAGVDDARRRRVHAEGRVIQAGCVYVARIHPAALAVNVKPGPGAFEVATDDGVGFAPGDCRQDAPQQEVGRVAHVQPASCYCRCALLLGSQRTGQGNQQQRHR